MSKNCFTLNEAIDYSNNFEVSTDDSNNEVDGNFQSAKIFIQPPMVNANNENSDISSG